MRAVALSCFLMLAGCSALRTVDLPSANQNSRINYLVLHFTSENFSESLRLLTQRTDNPVSAHYLVPEPGDDTYRERHLRTYRLVPEDRRAWHAGKSHWAGADALNDTSIGIEIVNQSACTDNILPSASPTPEEQTCDFLSYPEAQVKLVIALATDILRRHPEIDPVNVIGHADIAPQRRVDPGPGFPWKRLYENGIGAWYDERVAARYLARFYSSPPAMQVLQAALQAYGYDVIPSGENDVETRFAVRAFQMHFRPTLADGVMDTETIAILFALLEKYRPAALDDLLLENPAHS